LEMDKSFINEKYDIIHNPEKFILYVDGQKVE
jgi:lysyl-tRNA synthetase class II